MQADIFFDMYIYFFNVCCILWHASEMSCMDSSMEPEWREREEEGVRQRAACWEQVSSLRRWQQRLTGCRIMIGNSSFSPVRMQPLALVEILSQQQPIIWIKSSGFRFFCFVLFCFVCLFLNLTLQIRFQTPVSAAELEQHRDCFILLPPPSLVSKSNSMKGRTVCSQIILKVFLFAVTEEKK